MSEISQIEEKLRDATRRIHVLAPLVGAAKQVREYDSDRRKNLLATYALPHLKAGASAAAAEQDARANAVYQSDLEALGEQREASEKTIAEWEAAFCKYEAARSLLSAAKAYRELEREFEPR